jgi:hypothetical protein
MRRKRSSLMAAGAGSTGVHRQIQKIFQGEWSRSVSENQGEIKWQQASKVAWSTGKGISL